MNRLERGIVLWAIGYMAIYVPVFVAVGLLSDSRTAPYFGMASASLDLFPYILPFHFLGMAQNFVALVVTIRDLYRRPFPNPNDKVTWTLLILCTGGIGWLVYVFKYALKPRPESTNA